MKTHRKHIVRLALLGFTVLALSCTKEEEHVPSTDLVPQTVVEDPRLPRIEVNGAAFHCETFGHIGQPILVFLHGGPGHDYRSLISEAGVEEASCYPEERFLEGGGLSQLQDSYFCVFYDQRGAGLSQRFDKSDLSLSLYLDDLYAITEHFLQLKAGQTGVEESQVSLFGWSYGGTLATAFVNRYPRRVNKVVLFDPGPCTREAWEMLKQFTYPEDVEERDSWLGEKLDVQDGFLAQNHHLADYYCPELSMPYWRQGAVAQQAILQAMASARFDFSPGLHAFGGSMLYLGSSKFHQALPAYMEAQMRFFPNAESVLVNAEGTTGPWMLSDQVAGMMRDFLSEQ